MAPGDRLISVATLSLFRFETPASRLWVIGQMALARPRRLWSGARFVKLCGSGTGEGFTPKPNWSVWAIFAVWPDLAQAQEHIAGHRIITRWRAHAAESWTIFLAPFSARGSWAGMNPLTDTTDHDAHQGPIAALTRETAARPRLLATRPRHLDPDRHRPERPLQDRHRRGPPPPPDHLLDLARRRPHGRIRPSHGSPRRRDESRP
jgi:hypothetical protein